MYNKDTNNYLDFILEIGKLKGKKRRGWILHEIKNSETTAEHIFHLTFLVWLLGEEKNINLNRAIKMALVHDLCEVYAEDFTPYDSILLKSKKRLKEDLKFWPKFTPEMKIKKEIEKSKMENEALEKLLLNLSPKFKNEILNLWKDFQKGASSEARFVKQADKLINFLQGIEYWKKYGKIKHRLWHRWIKEIIDDPVLIKFFKSIEKKFY
jgi:putative hydrolase of HD superfamily